MDPEDLITISDLYPELSPEEQQEAEQSLKDYLQVVKKIYDRLQAEGKLEDVLLRIQYEKRNRSSAE